MPLLDNLVAAIGDVVEQRRTATFIVILAATLIIFALNLFIGLSFTRRFGQRVRSLLSIMAKAADGNISGRYSDRSKDEVHLLGEGLNKVLASLRDFLVRAGGAVSSAKDLGNHLSGSSTETATAFNEISENVASMRRQVENLDGMMRETAENATGLQSSVERLNGAINSQQLVVTDSKSRISEMNGAIGTTRSATNQALEETRKLVEATSVVNTKSQETGELVTLVGNDIESVAEFIALINDIADKTNILSLNAAIQSAHAGEAGKGFAVVAQEIQKLAETSRENALRIGERLHGMTENIRQVETISKENQVAVAGVHVGIQDFAIYQEKIGNQMEGLVTEGRTILSAFQELDGISSTVAEGAHDMDERSTAIASTARVAAQHCSEILNGIREIEQGNGDILASLSGVQDTARDSQQAVTELESGMAAFQVDDDL